MHFMSFRSTSVEPTMNSYNPCLFFETSAPARAGHYLVSGDSKYAGLWWVPVKAQSGESHHVATFNNVSNQRCWSCSLSLLKGNGVLLITVSRSACETPKRTNQGKGPNWSLAHLSHRRWKIHSTTMACVWHLCEICEMRWTLHNCYIIQMR